MIGIVGGVGPLAGLDLVKKIIEETNVVSDREHLPLLLSSQPHRIANATAFLLGENIDNPATDISKIILELEQMDASVIAMPCNTIHSPQIFDKIKEQLEKSHKSISVLHIVEETAKYLNENYPTYKVGILSTTGTKNSGLYQSTFSKYGLEIVEADDILQRKIHQAIYDESYGVKFVSSPVTNRAHTDLVAAIQELKNNGAQVIVLACIELSLALQERNYSAVPVVDPNRVLARALIRFVAPEKLLDIG